MIFLFAAIPLLCIFLLPVLYEAGGYEIKDWIKFRLYYRDYLQWKKNGGPYLDQYGEPIQLDRDRDDMVEGLSYEQIRSKIPGLTDGDQYSHSTKSYKGSWLKGIRAENPETRVLWFHKADDWDMGIVVNHEGNDIILIKG